MKLTKQLIVILGAALTVSLLLAAATTNPSKFGAFYSSNGSGNPGTWLAVSGSGTPYTGGVQPAGIMVSSDGSGAPGSWVAANANTFTTNLAEWVSGPKTAVSQPITQNSERLYSFNLPGSITATKISYNINTTADNTAALYDFGIYSATGTLLCHTGAVPGTTAAPAINVTVTLNFLSTGCALSGGTRYLFALTTSSAAPATVQHSGNILMAVSNGSPTTGSVTSGGVLNPTITPPADSWISTSGLMALSLHN